MIHINGTVRIDPNSTKELINQIAEVIDSNCCNPNELCLVIDTLESLIGTLRLYAGICYDLLQDD